MKAEHVEVLKSLVKEGYTLGEILAAYRTLTERRGKS